MHDVKLFLIKLPLFGYVRVPKWIYDRWHWSRLTETNGIKLMEAPIWLKKQMERAHRRSSNMADVMRQIEAGNLLREHEKGDYRALDQIHDNQLIFIYSLLGDREYAWTDLGWSRSGALDSRPLLPRAETPDQARSILERTSWCSYWRLEFATAATK